MGRRRFKDKYRIEPARWRGHDYAAPGWYSVTICTKGRACFFGEVRGGVMGLSEAGCVAHRCWEAIPDHVPRVRLDAFVVMPNHVHGIIGLLPVDDPEVETLHATSLQRPIRNETMSDISPEAGSLGSIVRSYKSAVTRQVRRDVFAGFAWQPRFHDRVVRHARALHATRRYVAENPLKWLLDRNHPSRLP